MKILMAAVILVLGASTAVAEAPCQNPLTPPCQRACAIMGAKYVLLMRQQTQQTPARVQTVRAGNPAAIDPAGPETGNPLEVAQRLARIAGLSLQYIDGMKLQEIKGAIAESCHP
jgi:hypothetical protein